MIKPNHKRNLLPLKTSLMVVLTLGAGCLPVLPPGAAQSSSSFLIAQASEQEEADRLHQQVTKLYQQGKYAEAIPLAQRELAIRKQLHGENHPDVATSLNNLAELYRAQGRYTEAEPLYKQSLAMSKRLLGENHPSVATILNNLAELYRAQGRYSEAEPLLKQAEAIK
jgi:tetratricopeptide (TPR) repeat protein